MAKAKTPKKKSLDQVALSRVPLSWVTPSMSADRWRRVVRQQPVAIVARDRLITYVQALPWEIRARQTSDENKYSGDVDYYTDLLRKANRGRGFDTWLDLLWQDGLDLPIGGNTEVVRYPKSFKPDGVSGDHPVGHVYDLINMDGATLNTTYNDDFPLVQRVNGSHNIVTFSKDEVARIMLTPRPELEDKGWSMPPPERIYLAINMLYQGDRYYAGLLIDTPEAGILDLMDMDGESASDWIDGVRTLFEGGSSLKVPILYEHEQPARFIPFGRPPVDLLFDTTTEKYARLVAAGYWLTLSDLGLEGDGSLAGQIRRERSARMTGYGVVKEKTRGLINNHILPPYLEFHWVEKDEEAMIARGRAALVMSQAMGTLIKSGIIGADDAVSMLKKDGILTVDVDTPTEPPPGDSGAASADVRQIMDKVPADAGGRGDITPTTTKSIPSLMAPVVDTRRMEIFQDSIYRAVSVASEMLLPVVKSDVDISARVAWWLSNDPPGGDDIDVIAAVELELKDLVDDPAELVKLARMVSAQTELDLSTSGGDTSVDDIIDHLLDTLAEGDDGDS